MERPTRKTPGYATPTSIRRMGASRLSAWLKTRGARYSARIAQTAVEAAKTHTSVLPSEATGSLLVSKFAATITSIDADLAGIDAFIAEQLKNHEDAEILMRMPGFGPYLAASLLAQIGGSLDGFDSADKLASLSGLAPVPRDSGRISYNLHRPGRFNRRLLRTCYLAALSSLKSSPTSRAFYDRKRAEGKTHKQALLALARRRINVIWAMLLDHSPYIESEQPLPIAA